MTDENANFHSPGGSRFFRSAKDKVIEGIFEKLEAVYSVLIARAG